MRLKESALEKAFTVTSYFEGGYTAIAGNFDGQGLSLGFLQWNFGQGTLQQLFTRLFDEFPEVAGSTLPEGGKWLKDALENNYVLQWAKQLQANNKVVEPWKTALYNLCSTEEFQRIQKDAAKIYVDYAINMCKGFGLTTDRAFALMFDIAVQCGVLPTYELAEPTYAEKLEAVANVSIRRCLPQWREDVRKRKHAIIYGKNLGRGWAGIEFNDDCAFEEEEKEPEIPEILKSINTLHECGVISDTSYWAENCKAGGMVDGAYMQTLINRFTAMYVNGLQAHEEVVNVLRDLNIIGDMDYWLENAVPNKTIDGEYGSIAINRMAEKIQG